MKLWNLDIFIYPSFINFKIPINIQNYLYNLLEKNTIISDKYFLKFLWFCTHDIIRQRIYYCFNKIGKFFEKKKNYIK